jgi:hypothetical protein
VVSVIVLLLFINCKHLFATGVDGRLVGPSLVVAAWVIGAGLLAIRATTARYGLDDLDLFAGTGVLDKMPDVDDPISAGVGAL